VVTAALLTPLAAAGMIGLMVVAIVVDHWKVGFFIFLPNQAGSTAPVLQQRS
jgi:hypothetical protein